MCTKDIAKLIQTDIYCRMKQHKRLWKLVLFSLYCSGMLFLLFWRDTFNYSQSYWRMVSENINIVPFETIKTQLFIIIKRSNPDLVSYANVNLFGNIALFIPFGFFLPWLNKKYKKISMTLFQSTIIILAVELIQLFTLKGTCDIDDLILNTIGILIGYIFYRLCCRKN